MQSSSTSFFCSSCSFTVSFSLPLLLLPLQKSLAQEGDQGSVVDHFATKVGEGTCGKGAVLTVRIPGRRVFLSPQGIVQRVLLVLLSLAVFCSRGTTCCFTTLCALCVVKLVGQCHRDRSCLARGQSRRSRRLRAAPTRSCSMARPLQFNRKCDTVVTLSASAVWWLW